MAIGTLVGLVWWGWDGGRGKCCRGIMNRLFQIHTCCWDMLRSEDVVGYKTETRLNETPRNPANVFSEIK